MFHLSRRSLFFSSIILAFFTTGGQRFCCCSSQPVLAVLTKLFWGRPVSYYLVFIYHKMVHRAMDYKRDNDVEEIRGSLNLIVRT